MGAIGQMKEAEKVLVIGTDWRNTEYLTKLFITIIAKLTNKPQSFFIGLYRENAIAIESEARDPNGGTVYYVTMQITFHIPEFARKERNLHCDVVHITTVCVSRLVLDHAIAAI